MMRIFLFTLISTLWFLPVLASDLTELNDDEREAFRGEVRAYLLSNPEVLMEAIQVLEERQQREQATNDEELVATYADAIADDGYSFVGGNPEGDITVVEFQDYRCGYCRRAHDEVKELVKSDGNIRLVVKEFPILGEQSDLSARLAVATLHKAGPEAYQDIADFLIKFSGSLTPKGTEAILKRFDLNAEEIMAYLDDPTVDGHIAEVNQLARNLQISGTPTFVVGSELVRGYMPLENMQELVAYHRELQK